MEHSCTVFCHGGYSGYRNASLPYDASFTFLSGAHFWARERWIKLLILALCNFDEPVDISCRFDEMTEYM